MKNNNFGKAMEAATTARKDAPKRKPTDKPSKAPKTMGGTAGKVTPPLGPANMGDTDEVA